MLLTDHEKAMLDGAHGAAKARAMDLLLRYGEALGAERLVETNNDGSRGINMHATCTPYQVGNVPVLGEHCAWMESSAVVYCNSVLGARTNTEGKESTGAAALTGRIPHAQRTRRVHPERGVRVDPAAFQQRCDQPDLLD
jgi:predicted aconitase